MFVGHGESQKNSFLEQTKVAREERAQEKRRECAAVCIQARLKGLLARRNYEKRIINDFDASIVNTADDKDFELQPAVEVYPIIKRFLTQFKVADDTDLQKERFERLCRYVNKSMEAENPKLSYASLSLQKDNSLCWIAHVKTLLRYCCLLIVELKPENHADSISLALYLHTLIIFTSPKSWGILHNKNLDKLQPALQKICCNIQGDLVQHNFFQTMRTVLLKGTMREELALKPVSLKAILTLCTRPLLDGDFSRNILALFLTEILSVPALIYHLETNAPACITQLQSMWILQRALKISEDANWFKDFGDKLPGTKALAFLGNIVNLFHIETPTEAKVISYPLLTDTTTILLETIPNTVATKGVFTQWHDLLGWYTPSSDPAQNQNVPLIKKQFHMLWGHKCIKILLGDQLKEINANYERIEFQPPQQASGSNLIRRALERSSTRSHLNKSGNKTWRKLDAPEIKRVSRVCGLLYAALNTLSQMKLDILSGICYNDNVLYDLWLLITSLGPQCGTKELLELLKQELAVQPPQISMLMLFCDCMTHYVTILDEFEMYTEQKHFLLNDYIMLTYFLNNFLYKIINENVLVSTKIEIAFEESKNQEM